MKKIVYTLLLCAAVGTTFAQTGKDCITAASICGAATVPAPTSGIGSVTDAVPQPCSATTTETGTGWNNTTWVTFVVTTAGTLQMNFDANPNADIDFALWRAPSGTSLATACSSLSTYNVDANRRCDYDADATASGFGAVCTTASTWIGDPGCDALGAMTVAVGERIIAVVSDYSTFDNLGFTPTLAGTHARACAAPCNNCGVSATCTSSSIYATLAAAQAATTGGCNADEVRPGLVAGTQVQQFCSSFTTPATLTTDKIVFDASVTRTPGTAGNFSFTSETLQAVSCGATVPVAATVSGYAMWYVQPSTTYEYCMTWTGNGTVTQMQNPCFRPAYMACSISGVTVAAVSACNNNGTPANASDDYFTADVTVNYTNRPNTGNLVLSNAIGTTGTVALPGTLAVTGSYTFTGVQFPANGTAISTIASFSADGACSSTSTSVGNVASCACAANAGTWAP